MPKNEDIIKASIEACQAKGIKIQRIPLLDWTDGFDKPPKACNAIGAVILCHGLADLTKTLFDPGVRNFGKV